MAKKFKSEAFESIHSSASALLAIGAIDKATMREFDESCITTESNAKQSPSVRVFCPKACVPPASE